MNIKIRFAPSPTGFLHIGSLGTAIYAYSLAKHYDGKFLLRIEDTDQKREVKGSVDSLKSILKLFNLNWDEFYVQSERVKLGIYTKAAKLLIEKNKAFYCQCEAKNAKLNGFSKQTRDPCRDKNFTSGAIKLKVPDNELISYTDLVGGKEISWNTNTVPDTTLLKSDGFPTYHLAVVVDDHEMEITHVLRGHDWRPSTPIHLLVYKYLDYQLPKIGHLTDILDPSGGKMSKRKGNVSVEDFLNRGYLKEAILNFVLLLGWAPKDNRELFNLDEFIEVFDESGLQVSNPTFNIEKLNWFNGQYIRALPDEDLVNRTINLLSEVSTNNIEAIIPLVKERIVTLKDVKSIGGFVWDDVENWEMASWNVMSKEHLTSANQIIRESVSWQIEDLNSKFLDLIKQNQWKTGEFFMNLRVALSGQKVTPPITECIILMGKDKTLNRISKAIESIRNLVD